MLTNYNYEYMNLINHLAKVLVSKVSKFIKLKALKL